jgi:hypothetical protein
VLDIERLPHKTSLRDRELGLYHMRSQSIKRESKDSQAG